MTITVSQGQNIVDVAIMASGSVEGIFDLLEANDLSMDDVLTAGQTLKIDQVPILNRNVAQFLQSTKVKINTGTEPSTPGSEIGDFNNDFNSDFF